MAFGPIFSPQHIIFRGLGFVLCRKQTTRNPQVDRKFSANTLIFHSLYYRYETGEKSQVNHSSKMFQSPQVNLSESNQISAVKSFQLNHQTHYLSRWLPVPYNIPYTPDSLGGVVNRSGVGRVQDLLLAVSGQCNVNVALWDLPATVAVPCLLYTSPSPRH